MVHLLTISRLRIQTNTTLLVRGIDCEQKDGEPAGGNGDVVLEANVEGRLDTVEE